MGDPAASRSRSTISAAPIPTWARCRAALDAFQQALATASGGSLPARRGQCADPDRPASIWRWPSGSARSMCCSARGRWRGARTTRARRSPRSSNLGSAYLTFGDTARGRPLSRAGADARALDRFPRRRSLRAAVARRRRVAQRRAGAQPRLPAAGDRDPDHDQGRARPGHDDASAGGGPARSGRAAGGAGVDHQEPRGVAERRAAHLHGAR